MVFCTGCSGPLCFLLEVHQLSGAVDVARVEPFDDVKVTVKRDEVDWLNILLSVWPCGHQTDQALQGCSQEGYLVERTSWRVVVRLKTCCSWRVHGECRHSEMVRSCPFKRSGPEGCSVHRGGSDGRETFCDLSQARIAPYKNTWKHLQNTVYWCNLLHRSRKRTAILPNKV